MKDTLVGFAILAFIGLCIWWMLPDSWTDKIKYSVEYDVDISKVERKAPPSDCNFFYAPLGFKGCHYKKDVSAFNSDSMLVGGDDAPKYSTDTNTHKPIVSYDDGKTWNWLQENE